MDNKISNHDEEAITSGVECTRRNFLVSMAGGLTLGFFMPFGERIAEAAPAALGVDTVVNAYIRINSDGRITLLFGGSEMGQGSMSGLSQILAEELMVKWDQITLEQSDANAKISYTTGGSSAVSRRYPTLRTAGATARELLIASAMLAVGDTLRANYNAYDAAVSRKDPISGQIQTWTYGQLAVGAASVQAQALLPATIPLTDPANFRLIGKPLPRPDIPLKTNGSAKYGIDVFIPGMVFAVIKHCPTVGGTLKTTPAVPTGAIAVVPCSTPADRGAVVKNTINAVAVVADNTWKASKLAKALQVSWTLPATTTSVDTVALVTQATQLLTSGTPIVAEPANTTAATIEAQVATALKSAAKTVEATFTLPYLAHATMEVLNCTVSPSYTGTTLSKLEIWAPNQAALSVVATAKTLTGLQDAQVIAHTTFLGGGLGRKIEQDYVSQAIQVALAVKKPVKLTWMREEDLTHDQYRPMAVIKVKAGITGANSIAAWYYRNVSPSISYQRGKTGLDSQAIEGAVRPLYNLGTYVVEWVPLPAGIPLGYWRSVGSSVNCFAVETVIDMLAQASGLDPFSFRYNILNNPRSLAVLKAADLMSNWRYAIPSNHAWGLALTESFGTQVCLVVEISQPAAGSLTIHRVAAVVDCGVVINPDSVEAQIQGGIIHGLTAALWSEMKFAKGVAAASNFKQYRMMRLNETPMIEVQILNSSNDPSGIGEPGVPPAAPALANAYSRLKKTRFTALPLFPGSTMGGL